MSGEELRKYDRIDVTASTDPACFGTRTLSPTGCLIHTTGGVDSLKWLQGGSARVGRSASANTLIKWTGRQYDIVGPEHYAYHAGVSIYTDGRVYRDNEVSQKLIGIELECTDVESPSYFQYDSLADRIISYSSHFNWRWPFVILGHYTVALPRGRRSDPVNFDWGVLMGRLYVRSLAARVPGLV